MKVGTVKWFSVEKGYGFIKPDVSTESDLFVHYTDLLDDFGDQNGFKSLEEGQKVMYEIKQTSKGLSAVSVYIKTK